MPIKVMDVQLPVCSMHLLMRMCHCAIRLDRVNVKVRKQIGLHNISLHLYTKCGNLQFYDIKGVFLELR